jgi:hypothetical protein
LAGRTLSVFSSFLRRPSQSRSQTPVAITTTRARARISRPSACTIAPSTLPCASRVISIAFAWLSTAAPWKAAVRATLSVRRASSTRASKYMKPPVRCSSRKVGQCDSTSALLSFWCRMPSRQPPAMS